MSLRIELVSPEKIAYEGDVELVIARTSDGKIGFQLATYHLWEI